MDVLNYNVLRNSQKYKEDSLKTETFNIYHPYNKEILKKNLTSMHANVRIFVLHGKILRKIKYFNIIWERMKRRLLIGQ